MEEIVWLILTLPFRIFWWAILRDFELLEESPATGSKAPALPPPGSPPSVWDRELDGP